MLKEILSVSGKPGLYKMISNSTHLIVVESLEDGKRFPVYTGTKTVALKDLSIYTTGEDMLLNDVFKRISEKANGGHALSHKESDAAVLRYIEEIIPEFDRDRVYISDMRKIIKWYNLLLDKNLLVLEEEQPAEKESTGDQPATDEPAGE
jgi:hypothetical protein